MTPIRWGIIGTGSIARKFADDVAAMPDAKITAVGSRAKKNAEAFGSRWAVPHRHGSYAELAENKEVDAVYVAVPHPFHAECSLLCLNAGKPVLCEKPFAMNFRQAEEVIRCARAKKLLLMEGMWTRCFPVMSRVRQLLAEGAIGPVRFVGVEFSFRANYSTESRLFNPGLGGGALLDIGVYTVAFASMVLGAPAEMRTGAEIGPTGVDHRSAMIFKYANGAVATLFCGLQTDIPAEAWVLGENGAIRVHDVWWRPNRMTVTRKNGQSEEFNSPYSGNGFQFEAAEFMGCLRQGRLESAVMPLDETLAITRTMDSARAAWGLRYPGE